MSVATVHLRADRSLVGDLRLVCREHGCWVEDRFGGFGPWWGQLGDAEALMAHTMTTHFRRPTVNERTPFDLHAAACGVPAACGGAGRVPWFAASAGGS